MDSPMDPRFGRARYFIVVDTDTGNFSAHDNALNLNAVQGAGIQSAKNIADLGVDALITGHVGPKAYTALEAAGIPVFTSASGTVQDALKAFQAGTLAKADRPTVSGHWV